MTRGIAAGLLLFAAISFGQSANGLKLTFTLGEDYQFAFQNISTQDLTVPIGILINGRKVPSYLRMYTKDAEGSLIAFRFSAVSAFVGAVTPWIVTLHPGEQYIYREPIRTFSIDPARKPSNAADHPEGFWAELTTAPDSDRARSSCRDRCWTGDAISNNLPLPLN